MKSSYVFAALVGFALLNTAFLGAYLYSSVGVTPGPTISNSATSVQTVASTASTVTSSEVPTSTGTVTSTITTTTAATEPSTTGTVSQPSAVTSTTATAAGAAPSTTYSASSSVVETAQVKSSASLALLSVLQFFEAHSLALAPGQLGRWSAGCGSGGAG